MLVHSRHVLLIFADMKDTAVNLGMKRLDAAIQHLRKAGELGNVFDGDAGIAQQLSCPSGRNQLDLHC